MKDIIVKTWKKYKNEFNYQKELENFALVPQMHRFESEVLYSLIRKEKPTKIIEFSPADGWSSKIMIQAAEKNSISCIIYSFDIISTSRYLDQDKVIKRKLIVGDAKDNVIKYMNNCDFLFIDSEHTAEFANWYLKTIIPIYKGKYIWIHDWNGLNNPDNWPEAEIDAIKASKLFNTQLIPIINLMDYTLKNFNKTIYAYRGPRGRQNRNPSQILYNTLRGI